MTRAADGHRELASRDRGRDSRSLRAPRVLLLEVEVRTSERTGRQWFSAWLGKARLIGFEDTEPNARGFKTIKFYAEAPTPKPD